MQDWSLRQESNLYLALRRHSFYPLNYEEAGGDCMGFGREFRPQSYFIV